MSALMVAPQILPFRWNTGRIIPAYLDVRLVHTDDGAKFFAEDTCRALGLEVDANRFHTADGMPSIRRIYPGHPEFVTELVDRDLEPIPVYTQREIWNLASALPFQYAADFIYWLNGVAENFGPAPVDEPTIAATVHDRTQTFSIALAAKYLSRDPQISLGRDMLFHYLRELGWLARDREVWIPAPAQSLAGTLVRSQTRSRGRKDAYPQVRLTVAGMEALHRALSGVAQLNLDDDTQLSLVEVE